MPMMEGEIVDFTATVILAVRDLRKRVAVLEAEVAKLKGTKTDTPIPGTK